MRVCTRCGNLATGMQRYCARCVAPLDDAEPPGTVQRSHTPRTWQQDRAGLDPSWSSSEELFGDPSTSDQIGDLFARQEAETHIMPLVVDADFAGEDEPDNGWRRARHRAPRRSRPGRRARLASAALAAIALLAGLATAWATFGTGPAGKTAAVLLASGVGKNPAAAPVRALLVSYFTAINTHDYRLYRSVLAGPARRHISAAEFDRGYRSTTDSGITLVSISPGPHSATATVTFTSRQDPARGGRVTRCTFWNMVLHLRQQGSRFLASAPPPGYHAAHHACGTR
jgi:hypothetical protein